MNSLKSFVIIHVIVGVYIYFGIPEHEVHIYCIYTYIGLSLNYILM